MEILDAHERLASLSEDERADLIDIDCYLTTENVSGEDAADAWPACMVGGLICLNLLAGLDTDADLRDSVRHLAYYANDKLIDIDAWREETLQVIDCLMEAGAFAEHEAAGWN
jgi:hypothetical protein